MRFISGRRGAGARANTRSRGCRVGAARSSSREASSKHSDRARRWVLPGRFWTSSRLSDGYNTPVVTGTSMSPPRDKSLLEFPRWAGGARTSDRARSPALPTTSLFSRREIAVLRLKEDRGRRSQPAVGRCRGTTPWRPGSPRNTTPFVRRFQGIVLWRQAFTAFRLCEVPAGRGLWRRVADPCTVSKDAGRLPGERRRSAGADPERETDKRIRRTRSGPPACEKETTEDTRLSDEPPGQTRC
jgi:hypothetical protein